MDQDAPQDGVAHAVVDDRATDTLGERVGVSPEAIGAPALLVDEPPRRIPGRDLAPPAQRQTMNPQAVVDERAAPHRDRPRRQDLEAEPGRGQALEVRRLGEEVENFGPRPRKPGFGSVFEDSQGFASDRSTRALGLRLAG